MANIENEYTLDVSQFKKATDIINKQNKKVQKSNEKTEKSIKKVAKGLKVVDEEAGIYRNSAGKLVNANGRFVASNNDADESMDDLIGKFKKGELSAGDFGAAIGALGIGAAVAKGVNVTKDAVNTYEGFQEEMLKVKAISGATEDQYKSLNDQAQQLGKTTAYSASQAAEAQKFFALAGFETNEILAATPKLMKLAAASGEDLGIVSDIVSDQMKAFGLSAEEANKMVDSLAKTATTSNTTVGMLGEALEEGGGTAASFNASLDDTLAILGTMANRSIKGSKAGNSLKNLFLRLSSPTDTAAESLEKYNIASFNAEGNMRGMLDIVGDVQKAMKGMDDEQKAAFLTTVFGRESLAGINAVLQTSVDEMKEYSKAISDAKGATAAMADVTMEGLQGELKEVRSMIDGIKIAATEANEARLTGLMEEFKELEGLITSMLTGVMALTTELVKLSLKPLEFAGGTGEAIGRIVRFAKTGEDLSFQLSREEAGIPFGGYSDTGVGAGEAANPKIDLMINVKGDGTSLSNSQINRYIVPALENSLNNNMLLDFNKTNRNKRVKP